MVDAYLQYKYMLIWKKKTLFSLSSPQSPKTNKFLKGLINKPNTNAGIGLSS